MCTRIACSAPACQIVAHLKQPDYLAFWGSHRLVTAQGGSNVAIEFSISKS